ncbi:hypothetical protein IIA16_02560 [bacterium]|nr:hypothetical protein [bacterium]
MANYTKTEKKETVLRCLLDGNSVRGTGRIAGVHKDTVLRILARCSKTATANTDPLLHDLPCGRMEVDEIWGYVGKKPYNMVAG